MLKAGQPLPNGVIQYQKLDTGENTGKYFRMSEPELTCNETIELLGFKQIEYLKSIETLLVSIRASVVFFVAITIISIIICFIAGISGAFA